MLSQPLFDLAIVVPLCKPKAGWPAQLVKNMDEVQQCLPGVSIQFIVVNDGYENPQLLSLFELLQETYPNVSFISYETNMGKGFALRTGVMAAEAMQTITTDLDFPYLNENIVSIYKKLMTGFDVVCGKRKAEYYSTVPFKRKIISKACIWLNEVLLKLPNGDTQSGLKGFNQKGKKLFLDTRINRFLIDTEFLLLAYKKNCLVGIEELVLRPGIQFSSMGWRVIIEESKNLLSIVKRSKGLHVANNKTYHVQPKNIPDVRLRGV